MSDDDNVTPMFSDHDVIKAAAREACANCELGEQRAKEHGE